MYYIAWKHLKTGVTGRGEAIFKSLEAAGRACKALNGQENLKNVVDHWPAEEVQEENAVDDDDARWRW